MSDLAAGIIALIVGGALIVLVFTGLDRLTQVQIDKATVKCQELYGKDWTGTSGRHGRPNCVNSQGEGKFLRSQDL